MTVVGRKLRCAGIDVDRYTDRLRRLHGPLACLRRVDLGQRGRADGTKRAQEGCANGCNGKCAGVRTARWTTQNGIRNGENTPSYTRIANPLSCLARRAAGVDWRLRDQPAGRLRSGTGFSRVAEPLEYGRSAPMAKLDKASAYEAGDCRFESCSERQSTNRTARPDTPGHGEVAERLKALPC